jgi:Spy/CpxP family protein refolding chaperone
MVKTPVKSLKTQKRPINHASNTLKEYSELKKSRQQINQENYQKRKEQRKGKRRERYQQQKLQAELSTQQA